MKQKRGMRILSFVLSGLLSLGVIGNANLGVKRVEAATEVAINETNFHDEGFRNYVYEKFDLDKNWSLSSEEISRVKEIEYSSLYCSDLTGIEHFTALQKLHILDNSFTSLNLSKNTELRELICRFTSLKEIDLRNNKKLTRCDCSNNALESIQVSGLKELQVLQLSSNALSNIELKGLDGLKNLYCVNNQLENLDLSECPGLIYLLCDNNKLAFLDLSKQSNLTWLGATNNQMAEIDLRPTNLLDASKGNLSHSIRVGYQGDQIMNVYVSEYDLEIAREIILDKTLGNQGIWLHGISPISITKQPTSVTVEDGGGIQTFSVAAVGRGLTYEWFWRRNASDSWKSYTPISSTATSCKVDAIYARNGFQYCCEIVDDRWNEVVSEVVTLTVLPGKGVEITKQPTSQTAMSGNVTFSTAAVGSGLTYQWYWRRNDSSQWSVTGFTGSKTAAMTVEAIVARNGFQYRCEIKDKYGNVVYTNPVTLNVPVKINAAITEQPANQTAKNGNAVFTVGAIGDGLTYQWYWRRNASNEWGIAGFTGAKTASMQVPVIAARNGFQYRCEVKDKYGNVVYSDPATLYYGNRAAITRQPIRIKILAGNTATFTITTTGDGLTYQWYWRKNFSSEWGVCGFTGARTASMQVPAITARNGFQYQCVVKDKYGNSVTSNVITFVVE